MRTRSSRRAVVPSALAAVAASAAPASANVSPVLLDVVVHTAPSRHTVVAECELGPAYSTDARFVTYVVRASAWSAGPSPSAATGVQCTAYDPQDQSHTYGGASGALPGSQAIAVGQAIAPAGVIPAVCVSAGATFYDGTTIASRPCP